MIIEQITLKLYNRLRVLRQMNPVSSIDANKTAECDEMRQIAIIAYKEIMNNQGEAGNCPSCFAYGRWDFTKENKMLRKAIWYNEVTNYYECYECWIK
jgi:hypothetical protein